MSEENKQRIVSKEEVNEMLLKDFNDSTEQFDALIEGLRHGQKTRLLKAIVRYPIVDTQFPDDEPELRQAISTAKRLSDILVSQGVSIVVDSLLNPKKQPEGDNNVETTKEN